MTVIADDIDRPNGLCLLPDESVLYVVASRSEPMRTIFSYNMASDEVSVRKDGVGCMSTPGRVACAAIRRAISGADGAWVRRS